MNDAELAAAADANYAETFQRLVPIALDAAAEERDGMVLVRMGVPISFFNVAYVSRPLADPGAAIEQAIAYFDAHSLPFHVRMREGVDEAAEQQALAHGLPLQMTQSGMCLAPIPDAPAPPADLRIEVVSDPESFGAYVETMAAGFGLPLDIARQVFPSGRWADVAGATWYLGYVDGEPATTSALVLGPQGVAGVYNVATLDRFRRRGLGEAMTWRAIQDGKRAGARIATLQASDMGLPIYERMGFRTVAPYRVYTRAS
ncbi:MAG: GNAT family N-acetyltransferase [Candidatus Binatia bacterium]